MKILILSLLIYLVNNRKVRRIIKTNYDLPFNDDLKEVVEVEFSKFEGKIENFNKNTMDCVEKHIVRPDFAEKTCFGDNFSKFNKGFDLLTFKIKSIFENMLEIAFNKNCINKSNVIKECFRLLEDTKILINNEYDVIRILNANEKKYLTANFQEDDFKEIFSFVKFIIEKFKEFEVELPNHRLVTQGLAWSFFLKKKGEMKNHELFDPEDSDLSLLDQPGGHDLFFAKKFRGQIDNKFGNIKDEYRGFLKDKGIKDPNMEDSEENEENGHKKEVEENVVEVENQDESSQHVNSANEERKKRELKLKKKNRESNKKNLIELKKNEVFEKREFKDLKKNEVVGKIDKNSLNKKKRNLNKKNYEENLLIKNKRRLREEKKRGISSKKRIYEKNKDLKNINRLLKMRKRIQRI